MEIKFAWAIPTSTIPRDVSEAKIREDVESDPDIHPCHPEIITARVLWTDPLEDSIKGELVCTCGKPIATFSGSSDGSTLTWE